MVDKTFVIQVRDNENLLDEGIIKALLSMYDGIEILDVSDRTGDPSL